MEKFVPFKSKMVLLPVDNIDTDQIIPARFLKTISKEGLGDQLFCDWRYEADGSPVASFPLNAPGAKDCQILLAGNNFGCGSSREHAPWALTQFGFRAVISTSFADIFKSNSLKNGLLPLVVTPTVHKRLLADSNAVVGVDLASQKITLADGSEAGFPVDSFSKTCLMEGVDELGYLLGHAADIASYEKQRFATLDTLSLTA